MTASIVKIMVVMSPPRTLVSQFLAYDYPNLSRGITKQEYSKIVNKAQEVGLTNLDVQGYWWVPE